MTLPTGQFEFRRVASVGDREVVQAFDEKGRLRGQFLAIPAARADGERAPEKPEITFMETPANMPQALKVYWYPGSRSGGHELIYPRGQARVIAQTSQTSVLTTAGADMRSGGLARMSSNGTVADLASLADANPRRALPETASDRALVLIAGIVGLLSGVAFLRRQAT